jgi:hypothetical protein
MAVRSHSDRCWGWDASGMSDPEMRVSGWDFSDLSGVLDDKKIRIETGSEKMDS